MALLLNNTDQLLKEGWEAQIWEESQERDVLEALTGTYSEQDKTVPDGIINRVMLKEGEDKRTIPMVLDLVGAGRQGADKSLVGFTETPDTRFMTCYSNDVRHGEDLYRFGKYAQRSEWLVKAEGANKRLSKWLKARRGKHKRQAMLERISDNLEETPTTLTSAWNKNIFIPGLTDAQMPDYDSTLATHTSNIYSALGTAGTTSAANIDAGTFAALEYWVTSQWKMETLSNDTYILLLAGRTARRLRDMTNSNGLTEKWRTTLSDEIAKRTTQGVLGQVGKFIIVVDDRAPILVRDTADSSLTAYYRDVGNTDNRSAYSNAGTTLVYDVSYVIGMSGLTETISMLPRYDDDTFDIGKTQVIGMSTTYGFQVTEYDDDTATDSSRIGQNCGVILDYSGNLTT